MCPESAAPAPRPVLSIEGLTAEFRTPDGPLRAADGVSYQVNAGETLGIVGESGSGKSVTVLAALGLQSADNFHLRSGRVLLDGVDLVSLSPAERRRRLGRDVAMVFQDPIRALNPVQRVGDQIAEALRVHDRRLSRQAARARAVELLSLVGVSEPGVRYNQYPHQFSGGMSQRAVIAMAIANRPKVLIADEPTTALDVSVQAQILDVLRVAKEETGAAVVLITHDLAVVAETADRVGVMYAGEVVETGPVETVFRRPRHPYTAALLACLPRLDRPADRLVPIPGQPPDLVRRPPGCAFADRCSVRRGRSRCVEQRPELTPAGGHLTACHFPDDVTIDPPAPDEPVPSAADTPDDTDTLDDTGTPDGTDDPVLRVRGATRLYPIRSGVFGRTKGHVRAVDGVSLTIRAGQTLGLVGESGCGKSTLASLLLRLVEATDGEIHIAGHDLRAAGRAELRRIRQDVQLVFQDPYSSLNPRLSVGDNVAEPLRLHGGFSRAERRARVLELFERVGLRPQDVDRFPSEFSGGQRQRVAIARALALRPKLLILDEPVSALDVSVQAQVLELLRELQRETGMAYLFVSHDLSVVRQIAGQVAVMYLGRIVETGPCARVFAEPQHPYTRALLDSVPVPDPARRDGPRRTGLAGDPPSPADPPSGCRFRTRCPLAEERCAETEPLLSPTGAPGQGTVACHFAGWEVPV